MKQARQSKTIWWNAVLILSLGLIELAATTFQFFIQPIVYAGLIFVSSAGNIILRFKTNQSLE
jgi:hypothetical protein